MHITREGTPLFGPRSVQYLPTSIQTTTTQGEHAANGEEQQAKPKNAESDGKTNMAEETAQLTHEVGKSVFHCPVMIQS